ncbi:MAG TPA: formylglycine-generating enzyme family protein [Blastocatellia bacterium]|nr:formylglycine-generating enzyme family protein [Blastocatellia bacterium]
MAGPARIEPEVVLIEAGPFLMGSDRIGDAEKPVHRIYLDGYYIGKFEVTNAQFKAFCDATGYPVPDAEWSPDGERTASDLGEKPAHPVVGINWEDAVAYCRWLSQSTGKNYRLPTEAEWEKAALGGLEGSKYPWGDEEYDAGGRYRANGGSDSDNDRIRSKDGFLYTAPVGSFPPNGYGLYDMAGNVWEWCADFYDEGYYSRSPDTNPRGPDGGQKRVLRGGSWFGGPARLQCAARLWNYPLIRYASTGFRIAMTQ